MPPGAAIGDRPPAASFHGVSRALIVARRRAARVATAALLAPALAGQPATARRAPPPEQLPVLAFPEAGLDDTAAYQGYRTRFFRDSRGNTVQIYLDRHGRAVHLWADDANESIGFTVRDSAGRAARLDWASAGARVSDSGRLRVIEHRLRTEAQRIELGWFLLGSMRVERDFQYARRHLEPFSAPPFQLPELGELVANLARLDPGERQRHLALLRARTVAQLRARLSPVVTTRRADAALVVRLEQPSLDDSTRLVLEVQVDPQEAELRATGRTVAVRSRSGRPVEMLVRVATDAAPLAPLAREEIFDADFLRFLARARAAHDSALRAGTAGGRRDSTAVVRYRWLERQVRGAELLSTRQKLMAGLPNFATYFGRDMMMTALMMRPIWSDAMSEHVIASVLRKLSPSGQVSHEEALGGQAIREAAAEYNALVGASLRSRRAGDRARADSVLARARDVLRELHAVRENYHMMDDEFQLPVLAARYLGDPAVPAERKRAFLNARSRGGTPHIALLLRELALVATLAAPYAREPVATNLVAFPPRDSTHWFPGSWRDSGAGYANGRFAMDINAIWVPQALQAIATILEALPGLGVEPGALDSIAPELASTPLAQYVRDPVALRRAIRTWSGARAHFVVALPPAEIRERVRAKLAWLPEAERQYWANVMAQTNPDGDTLTFLALSLDESARPIPVANTDPATRLYLEDITAQVRLGAISSAAVLREVDVFTRRYPVGLFVDGLGPVVANDAYAPRSTWEAFGQDVYHSPRVVWGREVNLFLLGLARQMSAATDGAGRPVEPSLEPYIRALGEALRRTTVAVEASGLKHNELWSFRIDHGRLVPTRYGTSSDIQLWNVTDLAVQYAMAILRESGIGSRE